MRKIFCIFISVIIAASAFTLLSYADESDIFTYTVNGTEATITGINHDGLKEVTIPETIDGYTVTTISKIEMVLDFGTENMVDTLFIPKTVTSITSNSLGYFDCAKFEVDEENPYFSNDEHGVLFNKNKTTLIRVPCSMQESEYTIPETVTQINSYALEACVFLQNITFPAGIESINVQTCMQMINLESVEIPEGVTKIDQNAFAQCYSLKKVTLPSTLTEMLNGAFTECPELEEIIIPDNVKNIEMYAFESDSALRTVTLQGNLTKIGYGVFQNCSSLENVCYTGTEEEFGNISIGNSNSPLTAATMHYGFDLSEYDNIDYDIEDGVLSIDGNGEIISTGADDWHYWDAFRDDVTTIITGSGITSIGDYTFDGFGNLEFFIPRSDNLTIGSFAFDDCANLRNIVAYGSIQFADNAVTNSDTRIFICGGASGIDAEQVINYTISDGVLDFENFAEFTKHDFFDILAVICNYGEVEKITFNDIQFSDIDLMYICGYNDGTPEYKKIEDNRLTGGEITVKLPGSNDTISFNELVKGLDDETISEFSLVIIDENHPEISDTTIEVEPEEKEETIITTIGNAIRLTIKTVEVKIMQGIKWAVTLMNKLFRYIGKK